MPIVGFNFSKINAEIKNENYKGNINVNILLPTIKSLEKKDDIAGMKDIISIEFFLSMTYDPKIGQIDFSGHILYQGEKAVKALKTWKERKILDEEIALDIYNHVFRRCSIKAFSIADDVRLPPPVTIPLLTKGEPKKTATAG